VRRLILASMVLAFFSVCWGQTPGVVRADHQQEAVALLAQKNAAQATPRSPLSSATCAFTFTSGANDTFLKYCVTANGNIALFQTPAGHEHIAVGQDGEGYGLCDLFSATAYNDYAEFGDSANWGPATVLSQNAKSVKIARTTSDGAWTLTQTFTQVAGSLPSVKIAMAMKNNTTEDRVVDLVRYADVDADGASLDSLDGTAHSAFGWQPAGNGRKFGLAMQDVASTSFHEGFAQSVPQGPAPCDLLRDVALATLTATDGSIFMFYELHVPKGTSKTVTVSYRGL